MSPTSKKLKGGNNYIHAAQQPVITYSNSKSVSFFKNPIKYIHDHIMYLNNSKFFAGIIMIMLNIGSKFISVNFSKSTEEYLKYSLSKQILVFAMVWMATRDIYTALVLTAVFVILSEHLFNEESNLCIVPQNKRVLPKPDETTNNNGLVTEDELTTAIGILEKAKKEKQQNIMNSGYNK
jgi:hypothetical protein